MAKILMFWFFFGGFCFLIGTSLWAIITLSRIRQEQTIVITMLKLMIARAGLKESVETLLSQSRDIIGN